MTKDASDEPIVLTVTIYPFKDKKRKIVVSGAPKHEMPIMRQGLFGELHALVDQVYRELLGRKPQVVKAAAKADAKQEGLVSDEDEPATESPPADQIGPVEADQGPSSPLVTAEPPAELPVIEGDDALDESGAEFEAAAAELMEG